MKSLNISNSLSQLCVIDDLRALELSYVALQKPKKSYIGTEIAGVGTKYRCAAVLNNDTTTDVPGMNEYLDYLTKE